MRLATLYRATIGSCPAGGTGMLTLTATCAKKCHESSQSEVCFACTNAHILEAAVPLLDAISLERIRC